MDPEQEVNTEDEEQEVEQDYANEQRLKAAVHYTVGKICEKKGDELGVTFSKPLMAVLAQVTFKQVEELALDLELFAKHAKRSTVQIEDVKLCARKSDSLSKHIAQYSEGLLAESNDRKAVASKKRKVAATK
eukprot:Colp12_sorted_trinity150504_noHs@16196